MPIYKQDDAAGIAFKFVMNPAKIKDLDELYDALEVNRGINVKYVVICNPGERGPAKWTVQ